MPWELWSENLGAIIFFNVISNDSQVQIDGVNKYTMDFLPTSQIRRIFDTTFVHTYVLYTNIMLPTHVLLNRGLFVHFNEEPSVIVVFYYLWIDVFHIRLSYFYCRFKNLLVHIWTTLDHA